MKLSKKLSLKEEMEKDAKRIEQKVVFNPDIEDVEVSSDMEASLLKQILTYEKKRAAGKIEDAPDKTDVEFSEEISPNFYKCTKDGNVVRLSEEDLNALRLGREMLKKERNRGEAPHEVNKEYHKHLNRNMDGEDKREDVRDKLEAGEKKRFRMPGKKRFIAVIAAVCVLVVATGVTSIGSKSYLKIIWERIYGGQTMQVTNVKDMDTKDITDGDRVTAYKQINDKLGFLPVRLGYIPESMVLTKTVIEEEQERAFVFYKYKGEIIRYAMYKNEADSSLAQNELDTLKETFQVETKKQNILVKEYDVKGYEKPRFFIQFAYKGVHYELKGIMDTKEILKIVENLVYFD